MIDLIKILSLSIGVFIILFSTYHSYKIRRMDLLSWSLVSIAIFHCFAFSVIIDYDGYSNEFANHISSNLNFIWVQPFFVILLSSGVVFGWEIFSRTRFLARKENFQYLSKENSKLIIFGWIILIFWIVATYLYTKQLGGLIASLAYTRFIRSGFEVENSFSFLFPFNGLSLFALLLFISLKNVNNLKLFKKIGLIISSLSYIYTLVSYSGRVSIIFGLGIVLFIFLIRKNLFNYWLAFLSPILAFISISILHFISRYMGINERGGLFDYFAGELSFPLVSLLAHIHEETNFRWMFDFIVTPAFLLPSSIHYKYIDNIMVLNTITVAGIAKGDGGGTSAIPVDLITLGYLQAGAFGVLIVGIMFGVMLKFSQRIVDNRLPKLIYPAAMAYFSFRMAIAPVIYADPPTFIGHQFGLIATIVLFWCFGILDRLHIRNHGRI